MALQGGMHDANDFIALFEPGGNLHTTLAVLLEPDTEGANAAQGEISVVVPWGAAELHNRIFDGAIGFLILCTNDTHHEVRMATDIFCGSVNRNITAIFEGGKQSGPVSIVDENLETTCMGTFGNGGDVHDLEAEARRAFDEDEGGIVSDDGGEIVGGDTGGEVGGLDTEALEKTVAEGSGGFVDGVCDQDVVAGLDESENGGVNGCNAGAGEAGIIRALECGEGLLEGKGGRVSVATVPHASVRPVRGGVAERGDVWEDDGGVVVDRGG